MTALLPTMKNAINLGHLNCTAVIAEEGGKDAVTEAGLFLKLAKRTRNEGKHLILLNCDTPTEMRAVCDVVVTELPQLFL